MLFYRKCTLLNRGSMLLKFGAGQSGGTIVEYCLITFLLAIVVIAGMHTLQDKCNNKLRKTANEISRVR